MRPHAAKLWFLAGLAFLLYANTIPHEYALDDAVVIKRNSYTKAGLAGIPKLLVEDSIAGFLQERETFHVPGGRYRPLSLITFAVEHQLFGLNPQLSHAINALLYAGTAVLIFALGVLLFADSAKAPWWRCIPLLTALIFVVHPLHTDVVANIKGRDEILALAAALGTLLLALHRRHLALIGLCYFAALLAKESAITFLAVVPLALACVGRDKAEIKRVMMPLAIAALVFLALRQVAIGGGRPAPPELMNDPFLYASGGQRLGTTFLTWAIYLRLLLFPHPLTADYYPYHVPLVGLGHPGACLGLVLALAVIICGVRSWRRDRELGFALLYIAATFSIVSNLFFNLGAFMAERFFYAPSLGFCVLMAMLIARQGKRVAQGAIVAIVLLGSLKTIVRNGDWKDDLTLFAADSQTSANSAFSHFSYGVRLTQRGAEGDYQLAREHLERAVAINPGHTSAWQFLGSARYEMGDKTGAIAAMERLLAINPNAFHAHINLGLWKRPDYAAAIPHLQKAHQLRPDDRDANFHLGLTMLQQGQPPAQAMALLQRAVQVDPGFVDGYRRLGAAQFMAGDHQAAATSLERVLALQPDPVTVKTLVLIYEQLGDEARAAALRSSQ
jgi:tetratricopeptide (TPR) repeat protein